MKTKYRLVPDSDLPDEYKTGNNIQNDYQSRMDFGHKLIDRLGGIEALNNEQKRLQNYPSDEDQTYPEMPWYEDIPKDIASSLGEMGNNIVKNINLFAGSQPGNISNFSKNPSDLFGNNPDLKGKLNNLSYSEILGIPNTGLNKFVRGATDIGTIAASSFLGPELALGKFLPGLATNASKISPYLNVVKRLGPAAGFSGVTSDDPVSTALSSLAFGAGGEVLGKVLSKAITPVKTALKNFGQKYSEKEIIPVKNDEEIKNDIINENLEKIKEDLQVNRIKANEKSTNDYENIKSRNLQTKIPIPSFHKQNELPFIKGQSKTYYDAYKKNPTYPNAKLFVQSIKSDARGADGSTKNVLSNIANNVDKSIIDNIGEDAKKYTEANNFFKTHVLSYRHDPLINALSKNRQISNPSYTKLQNSYSNVAKKLSEKEPTLNSEGKVVGGNTNFLKTKISDQQKFLENEFKNRKKINDENKEHIEKYNANQEKIKNIRKGSTISSIGGVAFGTLMHHPALLAAALLGRGLISKKALNMYSALNPNISPDMSLLSKSIQTVGGSYSKNK